MNIPYSENLKRVIYQGRVLARNLGHNYIAPEHLMLALLDSSPEQDAEMANILSKLNINSADLKHDVKLALGSGSSITTTATIDEIPLLSTTERIMRIVRLEASALRQTVVDTPHLFLAIMHESNTRVQQILNNYHVTYDRLLSIIDNRKAKETKDSYLNDDDDEEDGPFSSRGGSSSGAENRQRAEKKPISNSDTPVLDNFSTDISKAAEEGRLDPVVGR